MYAEKPRKVRRVPVQMGFSSNCHISQDRKTISHSLLHLTIVVNAQVGLFWWNYVVNRRFPSCPFLICHWARHHDYNEVAWGVKFWPLNSRGEDHFHSRQSRRFLAVGSSDWVPATANDIWDSGIRAFWFSGEYICTLKPNTSWSWKCVYFSLRVDRLFILPLHQAQKLLGSVV